MSVNRLFLKENIRTPAVALGALIAITLFGLFVVGYDQGQIESAAGLPADSSQPSWTHEFFHDMRHSAGFPCH